MSSRQRGGFGSARRVVVNSRATGGATLNERFTQLKKHAPAATTAARRVTLNTRSSQNRYSTVMSRRTGQAPQARAVASIGGGRGRGRGARGSRGGRGGFRNQSTRTNIGGRTVRGRGAARGGGRGGRGGRGRGGRDRRPVSKDDLDKDLDSYMGGSKKYLDEELDQMQTDRSV